MAIYFSTLPL